MLLFSPYAGSILNPAPGEEEELNMPAELAELEKRLFSVENVMQMCNLGRTKVYEEMDSGRLRSVKIGRRRLVSAAALDEFIAQLEAAGK
jgi:excisionase family DNA binding protein